MKFFKNRMMSTRRKILNYIFDVWSLKPSGKRLILDELLGRFDKQNIAVDLFHRVFPDRRAIIVKYERRDTAPFSGEILSENVEFVRVEQLDQVDGDPNDSGTGEDDLYHRCMRQLKQPTEKERAIHRAVYEIGNYLIRTRETPWDAPTEWREPTLEELEKFFKVDGKEKP